MLKSLFDQTGNFGDKPLGCNPEPQINEPKNVEVSFPIKPAASAAAGLNLEPLNL